MDKTFKIVIKYKGFSQLYVAYGEVLKQIKKLGRLLLLYNGISITVFIAIWLIGSLYIDDFGIITRDPAQLFEYNPFIGIISQIGILIWCAAVAVCFFVYAGSRDLVDQRFRIFLLSSAILTLYLLLDDMFLIHEIIGPEYLHIKQNHFYGIYFLVFLTYIVVFLPLILRTEFILMGLAFTYFGASIIIDYIGSKFGIEINTLLEDALKLIGIVSWFIYFLRTGLKVVRK